MPAEKSDEKYIGDGVYMHVEFSTCIRLRTERFGSDRDPSDLIYLEPDMLLEVIKQAKELGWNVTPRE